MLPECSTSLATRPIIPHYKDNAKARARHALTTRGPSASHASIASLAGETRDAHAPGLPRAHPKMRKEYTVCASARIIFSCFFALVLLCSFPSSYFHVLSDVSCAREPRTLLWDTDRLSSFRNLLISGLIICFGANDYAYNCLNFSTF